MERRNRADYGGAGFVYRLDSQTIHGGLPINDKGDQMKLLKITAYFFTYESEKELPVWESREIIFNVEKIVHTQDEFMITCPVNKNVRTRHADAINYPDTGIYLVTADINTVFYLNKKQLDYYLKEEIVNETII